MSDDKRPTEQEPGVQVLISPDGVIVRNGRDPEEALRFTPREWAVFLQGVKRGEFD